MVPSQETFQIEISQESLTPGSEPHLSPQNAAFWLLTSTRNRNMYRVVEQCQKVVTKHVTSIGEAATLPLWNIDRSVLMPAAKAPHTGIGQLADFAPESTLPFLPLWCWWLQVQEAVHSARHTVLDQAEALRAVVLRTMIPTQDPWMDAVGLRHRKCFDDMTSSANNAVAARLVVSLMPKQRA